MEQKLRERHRLLHRRRHLDIQRNLAPGPVAGPEGIALDDEEPAPPEDNDDVMSLSEGALDDDDGTMPIPEGALSPDDSDDSSVSVQAPTRPRSQRCTQRPIHLVETMYSRRCGCTTRENTHPTYGFKTSTYNNGIDPKQKVKAGILNEQFFMALKWTNTIDFLQSADLHAMTSRLDKHTDPDTNTVEWMHPMMLAAQASAEDNPTWNEAMNGPDKAGY
jgi:hypothetical protein